MKNNINYYLTRNPSFDISFIKGIESCQTADSLKIYIAQQTLSFLDMIKKEKINSTEVSKVYLFLQNYIDSEFPIIDEDKNIYDILFDGQIINEKVNNDCGPDPDLMKKCANSILENYCLQKS